MTNSVAPTLPGSPDAQAVPGLVFRPFHDRADYAAIAAIYNASSAADSVEYAFSSDELERIYTGNPNMEAGLDLQFAEVEGHVVAYTLTNWLEDLKGLRTYYHNTYTRPEWRDKGIEAAALQVAERRLREIAASHDTTNERMFEASANSTVPSRATLLQAEGYEPVRALYRMVRPDLENSLDAHFPEGIEVRPAQPDQYRAIWDTIVEGFADAWGMPVLKDDDYRNFIEGPFCQPHLWQVAWSGEQIVGSILNYVMEEENEIYNRARGYVSDIVVSEGWRRRGIARALLARTLEMYREKGLTEAGLVLDGQDPGGCLALCESMGFHVVNQVTYYRKPMS